MKNDRSRARVTYIECETLNLKRNRGEAMAIGSSTSSTGCVASAGLKFEECPSPTCIKPLCADPSPLSARVSTTSLWEGEPHASDQGERIRVRAIAVARSRPGRNFSRLGFAVSDPDDLKRLAQLPGVSGIESIDEPGGGRRVRLTDPDGLRVEIVHGIEAVKALDVPRQAVNSGAHA